MVTASALHPFAAGYFAIYDDHAGGIYLRGVTSGCAVHPDLLALVRYFVRAFSDAAFGVRGANPQRRTRHATQPAILRLATIIV